AEVDGLESAGELDRLSCIEHKERTQGPTADDAVDNAVVERQPPSSSSDRQIIRPGSLDDMADIERRDPPIEVGGSQGDIIQRLVLVVYREIGEALAPRIIRCPIQAVRDALAELDLEAVVAVPAAVIHIVQTSVVVRANSEGIEQEEVYRIGPCRVVVRVDPDTGAEGVAKHPANVVLVSGQSVCKRARFAIQQICDERG